MTDIDKVQKLVGNITAADLKHVEYYVSRDIGIFIPSTGHCGYAVQPCHTHPAYSFVLFLSEQQTIVTQEIEIDSAHYLGAVLPPSIPHEENPQDLFIRYIAIFVSAGLMEELSEKYSLSLHVHKMWKQFAISKEIMQLLDRYLNEYTGNNPMREAILDSLGFLIANELVRNYQSISPPPLPLLAGASIQDSIHYIEQNFSKPLSASYLAGLLGMSVSQFSRKFTKETGLPPFQFIIQTRLNKAKMLLRNVEMNITDIALHCGFSSSAHLTSSFQNHFNLTPSEYRRQFSVTR